MALNEERGGAWLAVLPLQDAITILGETPVGSALARLELALDRAFIVINRERGNDRHWYVGQGDELAAMLQTLHGTSEIADALHHMSGGRHPHSTSGSSFASRPTPRRRPAPGPGGRRRADDAAQEDRSAGWRRDAARLCRAGAQVAGRTS
jgi:hypothetical protein